MVDKRQTPEPKSKLTQWLMTALMRAEPELEKPKIEPKLESSWWAQIKEELWWEAWDMTDTTQVEWIEFNLDLLQGGVYHAGDFIGPCELECLRCGEKIHFTHPQYANVCEQCRHFAFIRHPLTS